MSETETEVPEGVDPDTGEVVEPEPVDDDPDQTEGTEDDDADAEEKAVTEGLRERMDEQKAAALVKALDREDKRHMKALETAYGSSWDEVSICPLCIGASVMVPMPHGAMPPEQFAAVSAFAGQFAPPELLEDKRNVVCENCGGWGEVKIAGSQRDGLSLQCEPCLGRGYVPTTAVTNVVQMPPLQIPVASLTPTAIPSYGAPGPNDEWGRPTGHTHYGIPPAAVTG